METLFNSIIEKIQETSKEKKPFIPPIIDGYRIEEFDYKLNNNVIYGKRYIIGDNNENIVLTYEVKDKNRTFQSNPDVNIVNITWSKNTKTIKSITETWENKI